MANDLGGDTLPYLAFGLRIDRKDKIRMGFDVDKTRRHGEAFGIDDAFRVASQRPTDRSDAVGGKSDALPLGAFSALGEAQKSESAGTHARGRRGMGTVKKKRPPEGGLGIYHY
jgi:hypothetical protein